MDRGEKGKLYKIRTIVEGGGGSLLWAGMKSLPQPELIEDVSAFLIRKRWESEDGKLGAHSFVAAILSSSTEKCVTDRNVLVMVLTAEIPK